MRHCVGRPTSTRWSCWPSRLPALPDLLRRVDRVAPGCRLTDAVSVKVATADAVRRYAPRARYVGGHPMAGTAESGWAAGQAGLFTDAAWVVAADDGLDPQVWADVAELAWACGARVVPAAVDEHDLAVAKISHLPHLFAAVLAAVGAAGPGPEADALSLALAASSFADGTRVAGTRPELVLAMCEGNRDALLAAVDDALGRLGAMRGALASTGGLAATVRAGYAGPAAVPGRPRAAHRACAFTGAGTLVRPSCATSAAAADVRARLDLTRTRARPQVSRRAAGSAAQPGGDAGVADDQPVGVDHQLGGEVVPAEPDHGRPVAVGQRDGAVGLLARPAPRAPAASRTPSAACARRPPGAARAGGWAAC